MASQTQHENPVGNPRRLCQHCGCNAEPRKFYSFTAKLKRRGWNSISAISTMFVSCSEQEHAININPTDGLCTKCWLSLGSLFAAYTIFQERRKKGSGLSELIRTLNYDNDIVGNDCNTNDSSTHLRSPVPTVSIGVQTLSESNPKLNAIRNPPKPKATTPKSSYYVSVKNVLRKKIQSDSGRRSFLCFIKNTVKLEMRSFCKRTMLRDQVQSTDDIQLWEKLYEELKGTAPVILTVLHTIAGRQVSGTDAAGCLDPMIGAGFCVLARARSQNLSRFQKMVGLILCSTSANKDTFQFLNDVGVSMSYSVSWSITRELVQPEADDNLKHMTQLEDRRFPQAPSMDMDVGSDLESDSEVQNNSGSESQSDDPASFT